MMKDDATLTMQPRSGNFVRFVVSCFHEAANPGSAEEKMNERYTNVCIL